MSDAGLLIGEKPAKDEAAKERRGPRAVVAGPSSELAEKGASEDDDLALRVSDQTPMRFGDDSPPEVGALHRRLDKR